MFEVERTNNGTSFRLCSLRLFDHPILHNISLKFSNEYDTTNNVYTTVIIGENGIGKSTLLGSIAEIFCYLERLKRKRPTYDARPKYYFEIEYKLSDQRIKVANFVGDVPYEGRKIFSRCYIYTNGIQTDFEMIELPQRVIVSATTIADKFVAKSTEMFRYKGLRNENSPALTGTRTMVRKTVSSLLESLDTKTGFRQELRDLLRYLKLSPRLELSYRLTYSYELIRENIEAIEIKMFLKERRKSPSDLDLNTNRHLEHDRNGDIIRERIPEQWQDRELVLFVNDEERRLYELAAAFYRTLFRRNQRGNYIRYNLLEEGCKANEDKEYLKALDSLDLLSYPFLKVFKINEGYEFDNSSSGESSLFCQLVNIMSVIEPGSVILIDEPECSTHPNWQISYMKWLEQTFKKYNSCHFVVSTHSHLLLSGLKGDNSSIIALAKDDKTQQIINKSDGINTFGWSADDILYEVFRIRNKHNKALERDLERAVQLLEEKEPLSTKEINQIIERFNKVYRGVKDPLGKFITELKEYAESKTN